MSRFFRNYIVYVLVLAFFVFGFILAEAEFRGPPCAPPDNCNIEAPLDTSRFPQIKKGPLTIIELFRVIGDVKIGPEGSESIQIIKEKGHIIGGKKSKVSVEEVESDYFTLKGKESVKLPEAKGNARIYYDTGEKKLKVSVGGGAYEIFGAGGEKSPWSHATGTESGIYYTNGNVGIGLDNPKRALDVLGNIRASGWVSGGSGFIVGSASSTRHYYVNVDKDGAFRVVDYTDDPPAARLVIDKDGKATIDGDLDITGSYYRNGTVFAPEGGESLWDGARGEKIYTNEKVGIGTDDPGALLEVAGSLKAASITLTSFGEQDEDKFLKIDEDGEIVAGVPGSSDIVAGVSKIKAGDNISVNPQEGTGEVTISVIDDDSKSFWREDDGGIAYDGVVHAADYYRGEDSLVDLIGKAGAWLETGGVVSLKTSDNKVAIGGSDPGDYKLFVDGSVSFDGGGVVTNGDGGIVAGEFIGIGLSDPLGARGVLDVRGVGNVHVDPVGSISVNPSRNIRLKPSSEGEVSIGGGAPVPVSVYGGLSLFPVRVGTSADEFFYEGGSIALVGGVGTSEFDGSFDWWKKLRPTEFKNYPDGEAGWLAARIEDGCLDANKSVSNCEELSYTNGARETSKGIAYDLSTSVSPDRSNVLLWYRKFVLRKIPGNDGVMVGGRLDAVNVSISNDLDVSGGLTADRVQAREIFAADEVSVSGLISAPRVCISGECKTSWPEIGNSEESLWSKSSDVSDVYYMDGKVGIGKEDPRDGMLHIKRSGATNDYSEGVAVESLNGKTGRFWMDEGGRLYITRASEVTRGIVIDEAGDVGIGRLPDSYKLDIDGGVRIIGREGVKVAPDAASLETQVYMMTGIGEEVSLPKDCRRMFGNMRKVSGECKCPSGFTERAVLGTAHGDGRILKMCLYP